MNEDGTYQTDSEGNYIYPYSGQKIKLRVNVKAVSGFIGDTACTMDWIKPTCNSDYCTPGTKITLADESSWKVVSTSSSTNTATLIYDHYINQEGNYDVEEKAVFKMQDLPNVDNMLLALQNKLTESFLGREISVSLPTADMLNLTLEKDYKDVYFLPTNRNYFNYGSTYILSEYELKNIKVGETETEYKSYYTLGNNKVGYSTILVTNNYLEDKVGVKPIITIPRDMVNINNN